MTIGPRQLILAADILAIQAVANNALPAGGGTMSGPLTVPSVAISGVGSTGNISAMSVIATGGSTARTGASHAADTLSVDDFGAVANNISVGAANTAAVQAAWAFCSTRGVPLRFNAGVYTFDATGLSFLYTDGSPTSFRSDIIGAGPKATFLNFPAGNFTGVALRGSSISADEPQRLSGLYISKADNLGYALALYGYSHIAVRDVHTNGANNGIYLQDVQESLLENCIATFANVGLYVTRSTITGPNAITCMNCKLGNNNTGGADFIDVSALNFIGGSVEGNNVSNIGGTAATWGARFLYTASQVQEGTAGFNFQGTYFENNGINGVSTVNTGDVFVVNSAFPITGTINACSFQRHSYFNTNCIRIETSGGFPTWINITGCGFRGFVDYTASALRPYVLVTNPTDTVRVFSAGNIFSAAIERPNFSNAANFTQESVSSSWVRFNGIAAVGAITPVTSFNTYSVSKVSTGVYSIVYATPLSAGANAPVANTLGLPGFAAVTAENIYGVTLQTYNTSGVLTDNQVVFANFGGGSTV